MNTNTNEFKNKVFKYLLESIESDDIELSTPSEKNHFFDR